MTRLRLHSSSPEFSHIAFGTWRLLAEPETATPEGLLERLRVCLDCGITTVDTAEIYGGYRVEELVGAALALDPGVKAKVELITKAGIYVPNAYHPDRRTAHYNSTATRLIKSAEKSLRFLGVDAVDLFLVHRPDWLTSPEETAAGLSALVRSGKAKSVGVSNYSASQFSALQAHLDVPLVTNQLEFHPFQTTPFHDGTFDQAQERRFSPMAWSPMAGGRIFKEDDEAAVRLRAAMVGISERLGGAGVDRITLAWIMAHPSRPLPVLGTSRVDRIRSAAAAEGLVLEREDWYAVWEAAHGRRIP